jgi:hypothetical protein
MLGMADFSEFRPERWQRGAESVAAELGSLYARPGLVCIGNSNRVHRTLALS